MQEEARKKEEAKVRAFRAQIENWNLCKMMREYIVEHERAFENATLEPELRQKTSERIAWAKEYVERVDPLKKPIELREPRESPAFWIDQDPDDTD